VRIIGERRGLPPTPGRRESRRRRDDDGREQLGCRESRLKGDDHGEQPISAVPPVSADAHALLRERIANRAVVAVVAAAAAAAAVPLLRGARAGTRRGG